MHVCNPAKNIDLSRKESAKAALHFLRVSFEQMFLQNDCEHVLYLL